MDQSIPPRRLTQPQQAKAATRAKVIAAATALFNAKSYDLVTMRDIADKANVSTGSIFVSFTGKQAVWEACGGLKMPTPALYSEIVHMLDIMSGEAIRLDSPADVFRAERAIAAARKGINGEGP